MKLKSLSIITVFLLCIVLGIGSPVFAEDFQEITIVAASDLDADHVFVHAANRIKEKVEAQSDGNIHVEIHPGAILGGGSAMAELLSMGEIDMIFAGPTPINMYAEEYRIIYTPFLTTSWEHHERLFDSPLIEEMNKSLAESGNISMLEGMYRGVRQLTSNREVRNVEDLEGLNMRLPELDNWIMAWEELGVSSFPVAMDELYTALATGVAEASEGEFEQIYTNRLFEVQDYVVLTNHLVQPGFIFVNNSFMESLNEPTKNLILEATQEASQWTVQAATDREAELKIELEKEGVEFIEVDGQLFRDAAMPALERMFERSDILSLEDVLELK